MLYHEIVGKLYEQKEEDIEAVVNYLIKTFYNKNTNKFKVNIDDKINSLADNEEDAKDIKDLLDKKIDELKANNSNSKASSNEVDKLPEETKKIGEKLVKTLQNYGINMEFTGANIGPSVTQYKFRFLDNKFKLNELNNLKSELAMSIPTSRVNIERVGPSTDEIGIQVPNTERTNVDLKDIESRASDSGVDIALGKDMNGNPVNTNIKDLQHVLIGGQTGCVDEDTEFFNGFEWKKISNYIEGDKVLVYYPNGDAKLEYPEEYIKEKADIFYHIHPAYSMDMMLSPEHNVFYVTSKGNLAHRTMQELYEAHISNEHGFTGKFIHAFNHEGLGINLTDNEIKLMLAVMADGSLPNKQKHSNRCRINLKKDRKKTELRNILNELNIEYTETSYAEGYTTFLFDAPLAEKHFSSNWYNCNKYQLQIIADNILKWDGCDTKDHKSYYTTCKEDADFVQFVFSSLGISAFISSDDRVGNYHSNKKYKYKSVTYEVIISTKTNCLSGIAGKGSKNNVSIEVRPDKYKYCFTTSTGMWILRRNGKITVTGNSGKSSGVNTMICSIIDNYSPDEVKLVLIDPKQVEMSAYEGEPHLLMPVVKGPEAAVEVLDDMVDLTESRYSKFEQNGVKNIEGYNKKVAKYNSETGSNKEMMPYIVIVIDELADLMATAGKQVENDIKRLTAISRAAGIHLIVATQRPSVDVVTGTIKANLPSRIAFSTASGVDSKTILDKQGAETLTGKGDMLFKPSGTDTPVRVQGAYVSDEDVEDVVNKSKEKYGNKETSKETEKEMPKAEKDENYDKAVQLLKQNKKISSSDIQLALRVPYSEAQRILTKMKENKVIK